MKRDLSMGKHKAQTFPKNERVLGESRLAFSTILPRPTAVVRDTSVAVAYDSDRCHTKYDELIRHFKKNTILQVRSPRQRTENSRVVLLTASVAICIVEAGAVALIDPLPEDRICQLTSTRPLISSINIRPYTLNIFGWYCIPWVGRVACQRIWEYSLAQKPTGETRRAPFRPFEGAQLPRRLDVVLQLSTDPGLGKIYIETCSP